MKGSSSLLCLCIIVMLLIPFTVHTVNLPSFPPLSGIKAIPGDYPTIAAAIHDMNTNGVGPGGVTFNVAAGYSETFLSPDAGVITGSGTASQPVVFQKSGGGSNPMVTAATGVGTLDGIIVLTGSDYVTFDGLDLQEDSLNKNNTTRMEWGYALLKASLSAPYNGCQHVTIRNCHVSLNKINPLSVGIYAGNHSRGSGTSLPITSPSDAMNNCKFYSNVISNVCQGISLNGYKDSAPYALFDTGNEIGRDGGNTITGFGGNTSMIKALNQDKIYIANNVINGSGAFSMTIGIELKNGQNTYA